MAEQQQDSNEKDRKKGFVWWWLLLPVALVAAWFFFGKKSGASTVVSPQAFIKICPLERVKNGGHCCPEDVNKLSIFETNSVLHVSADFPELKGKNAVVTGEVIWATGEKFPTQPISLVFDDSFGESCFVGEIKPANGVQWSLNKYKLMIHVDGQAYTEKLFEMDR